MFRKLDNRKILKIVFSFLGIACFLVLSGTMFKNISALQSDITQTTVTLYWTSPGQDGNTGTAWQYDIRYNTEIITEDNWATSTQAVGEPSPKPANSDEEFTVVDLAPNTLYYFAIKTTDWYGNTSDLSNIVSAQTLSLGTDIPIPESYRLEQNYPNPFNAETVINYYVPIPGPVKVSVYDILGRTVTTIVDGEQTIGDHVASWDGRDGDGKPVSSGIYFYRLTSETQKATRKMLLLK